MTNSKPNGINSKKKCQKSLTLTQSKTKMKKSNNKTNGKLISKEKGNKSYMIMKSSNNLSLSKEKNLNALYPNYNRGKIT